MKGDRIKNIYVINDNGITVGTSKGHHQDVDTGRSPGDYKFDMGIEFKVRIEIYSQYAGCVFKRYLGVV